VSKGEKEREREKSNLENERKVTEKDSVHNKKYG
jgi:hypothetical protein